MNLAKEKETYLSYIHNLLERNGPDPDEYPLIMEYIAHITPNDIDACRLLMQPILNPGTIIGFSFTKPFGYNGDFFIIEKIYQKYVNPDIRYQKWDQFFHTLPAAIAVVNRKELAIRQFIKLNNQANQGQKMDVLILGSGPANEVFEYLNITPDNHLHFTMVDLDQRAIDYAKSKNRSYLSHMHFINHNVIRFKPENAYDMIWSAGLFDYFKDKHFVFLIKKYFPYLKPGGEMIIGNFNVENPSRRIMEILGDWFLYHRSEEELKRFAHQADIEASAINVLAEPLGINLFLQIKR
jgi:extracellular factor (EF) 3-hydroxypalmitic acid methyl ester biosynthesis protein